MECVLLGWPSEGPTLRLDYRQFAYAGKFVMTNTGKAVICDPSERPSGGSANGSGETSEVVAETETAGGETNMSGATSGPTVETDPGYDEDVLAAVAFNRDRTDPATLWLRYVTVRSDCRGEGLGPRLVTFVTGRATVRGYDRVRIAVNNPFAYEALYKSGFAWTGDETGLAELVLERTTTGSPERSVSRYRAGFDRFRERDLSSDEVTFCREKRGASLPSMVG